VENGNEQNKHDGIVSPADKERINIENRKRHWYTTLRQDERDYENVDNRDTLQKAIHNGEGVHGYPEGNNDNDQNDNIGLEISTAQLRKRDNEQFMQEIEEEDKDLTRWPEKYPDDNAREHVKQNSLKRKRSNEPKIQAEYKSQMALDDVMNSMRTDENVIEKEKNAENCMEPSFSAVLTRILTIPSANQYGGERETSQQEERKNTARADVCLRLMHHCKPLS